MRVMPFLLLGALTGAVAAASIDLLPLGEPGGIEIAGHCFGIRTTYTSACKTIDGALYLFPGLVFGGAFAALLLRRGALNGAATAAYALVATVANSAAVFVCVSLVEPFERRLFDNTELNLAVAGGVAGAVGGGLLGFAAARLCRSPTRILPIAVAAVLGLLTPLVIMFDEGGLFAFYIIWQGGYAAALARSWRAEPARVTAAIS